MKRLRTRFIGYLAILIVGWLVMVLGIYRMRGSMPTLAAEIALIGVGIGVMGMVLLAVGITCQHCGIRLLLYAVSKYPAGSWLPKLLAMSECPKCGSPVEWD